MRAAHLYASASERYCWTGVFSSPASTKLVIDGGSKESSCSSKVSASATRFRMAKNSSEAPRSKSGSKDKSLLGAERTKLIWQLARMSRPTLENIIWISGDTPVQGWGNTRSSSSWVVEVLPLIFDMLVGSWSLASTKSRSCSSVTNPASMSQ